MSSDDTNFNQISIQQLKLSSKLELILFARLCGKQDGAIFEANSETFIEADREAFTEAEIKGWFEVIYLMPN